MKEKKYTPGKFVIEIMLILAAVIMLYPLVLTVFNSFKSFQEVNLSLITLPTTFNFNNYRDAWKKMNYSRAFLNSLFTTVFAVTGLVFISSAAAWQLARRKDRVSKAIFSTIIFSMIVPFQVLMIPLAMVAKDLGLVNSLPGLVIMYWGFLLSLALFLYHGFIKTVPRELEESAEIDGYGPFRVYLFIVLPLLKPITATVVITNIINVFNGFMLPLIMISSKDKKTIPLAMSVFYGEYINEWNLIMAALVLSLIPTVSFFFVAQNKIMGGLVDGAVKG